MFVTVVQVPPPLVEYCQLSTLPVFPLRVKIPDVVLSHTKPPPRMFPPTEAGFTKIVPTVELAVEQDPLWRTARYMVVTARFV